MTTAVDRLVSETSARKGVGTLKADKSPGGKPSLTPVGTERKVGIPDVPEVFLTNEAVAEVAADLRRQIALLTEAAEGLERLTGTGAEAVAPDEELERKLFEREADRKAADREKAEAGDRRAARRVAEQPIDRRFEPAGDFDAHWAQLSAEAKAAAFKGDLEPAAREVFAEELKEPLPELRSGSPTTGWRCPTHGDANLGTFTSRAKRTLTICKTCNQFDKGDS